MVAWMTRLFGRRSVSPSPAAPQPSPPPASAGPASALPSSTPLERYRAQIESFEEDREGLGAKLVRKLFTVAAYGFPFLAAYFVGKEIGDYYSGPFDPGDGWSGGTHIIAWAGEAALAMMVLATATAWRRSQADPAYTPKLLAALASLVVFSLASCLAQWVITYNHLRPQVASDYAALIFRVGMVPGVDIAALLYLSIMSAKSLKHYLGEMQQKAQAIRQLAEAEIAIEEAQQSALQRQEEARQYLTGRAELQRLITEIARINGQALVEQAKAAVSQRTAPLHLLAGGGHSAQNGASVASFPGP